MITKTRKMIDAEARVGEPLEDVLPRLLNDMGIAATAKELGVSKNNVEYWARAKFEITCKTVWVRPGQTLYLQTDDGLTEVTRTR